MDLTWARILFTLLVFVSFMLVLYVVFNKRNKANYDDVANIIVNDPDTPTDDVQVKPDNGAK